MGGKQEELSTPKKESMKRTIPTLPKRKKTDKLTSTGGPSKQKTSLIRIREIEKGGVLGASFPKGSPYVWPGRLQREKKKKKETGKLGERRSEGGKRNVKQ